MRTCGVCGEKFEDRDGHKELELYADHEYTHQPTAGQWHMAYHRIQFSKENHRPCDCTDCQVFMRKQGMDTSGKALEADPEF
jgi:hypothetical protein